MADIVKARTGKYLTIEDLISLGLQEYSPIEIGISFSAKNERERGMHLETRLGYFIGLDKGPKYDYVIYQSRLLNGDPIGRTSTVMLPIVEWIRHLR